MNARRRSDDGGAVIVEVALVLPLLFALIMGLIEFATTELDQSQASSAARDGARVGILSYRNADVAGSGDRNNIVTAVNERLTGQQGVTVQVRCTTGAGTTIACASVDPQEGYLEVTASWPSTEKTLWGFLIPETISGTSRMALVGAPINVTVTTSTTSPSQSTTTTSPTSTTTTTVAPPACQITSTPTVVGADAGTNGTLTTAMTIGTVVTNGDPTCGALQLRVFFRGDGTDGPSLTVQMQQPAASTWSYTFPQGHKPGNGQDKWNPGTTVTFDLLNGGGTVLGTYTFEMS